MLLPHSRKATNLIMKSAISTARERLELNRQHLRFNSTSAGAPPLQISTASRGQKYSTNFKQYAITNNKIISWFHDVPLGLDTTTKEVNMVVEIPRWSNAKFEIDSHSKGNPIVQDQKNGKVRYVKNLFPHHGYIHNYGAIPQTWEDPTTKHHGLDLYGDNDPLDICDIGTSVLKTGDVKRVKILGSIALIDDGELDWKVIAINVEDPLSNELFDIHDLYVKCPGLLETTRQWFRDYKLPDNKPKNKFAFNGVYKNQAETIEVILETHQSWKKLISGEVKGEKMPLIENTLLEGTKSHIQEFDNTLLDGTSESDAEIPKEIEKSYYLSD